MKLYVFEHCPYCVKARLVANYLALPVELVYLQNDDEVTPHRLIGAKMVPILQFADGTAMGESLDIARHLEQLAGTELAAGAFLSQANHWVSEHLSLIFRLTFPRWPQITLPEFATPQAIAYFQSKKEQKLLCSFTTLLSHSAEDIALMQTALTQLSWLNSSPELTWQDVQLLPFIRNLTIVKGLEFPEHVRQYLQYWQTRCDIPLFFTNAV